MVRGIIKTDKDNIMKDFYDSDDMPSSEKSNRGKQNKNLDWGKEKINTMLSSYITGKVISGNNTNNLNST